MWSRPRGSRSADVSERAPSDRPPPPSRAGRTRQPRTVDRQRLPPVRQAPRIGARVFSRDLRHLPHQRVLQPRLLDSATQRLRVIAVPGVPASPRRAWPAFPFPARNAAIPPRTPRPGRGPLRRPRRTVRRPASAARHRFDRLGPCLQRDDGFGHTTGIPGILRQPAFRALPGRKPRRLTTWAVVIGVVEYSSTARSRSSGPDIRKIFRSVSKKTSAAPYPPR